jgi:pilus assembly protein FimV
VVKEYTVLLDPPTTTSRRAPRVATPVATPRQSTPAVTARQPAPVAARPAAGRSVTEYGPVKPNETLWAIAREVRPAGVSMAQTMIGLLDANPQAFVDNNINKLRRGQILRVPGRDELLGLSRAQAQARYREQQDTWLAERDAVEQQATAEATAGAAAAEPQAELRIASARPSDVAAEAGASEGTRGREPALGDLNTQVLLAREEAESSRQEAELLRERVEALRDQLEDMQRLLTLKDDQLARLQGTVAESVPAEAAATGPAEVTTELPIEAETPEVTAAEVPATTPDVEVSEPVAEGFEEAAAEIGAEFTYVDKTPLRVVTEDSLEAELAAAPEIVTTPELAAEPEIVVEPETAVEPVVPAGPVAGEEPAPLEAPVTVEPEPAVTSTDVDSGFAPSLPMVVGGLAGVVVLGGLLGLVMARRGSRREPGPELAAAGALAAAEPAGAKAKGAGESEGVDSADLSDFASVDLDGMPEEGEDVDPVSEADVYIAYGRYQQAEQLLRQAMEQKPERLALPHKLLEVYYATRNLSSFVTLAGEMMADGRDQADAKAWERVKEMGRELDANNAMFTTVSPGAAGAGAAAAAGAAVASAAPPAQDDDGLGLDDLDLSELARDLEDEVDDAKASAAIEDPEPLSVDLEDAISQLEAEVEEERASALNDLESLDLELPSIEASGPEQHEQEVISLDELNQASSVGEDAENLVSQLQDEDEGLGADSVLTIDTDLEPTELQAELDQLSELSTLSDVVEGNAAAAGGEDLNLEAAFDRDTQAEGPETFEVFDGGVTSAIGEDEVQTKLDLARAYVEMGDSEGAKSILEEVQEEGSDEQRQEAGQILQRLAS